MLIYIYIYIYIFMALLQIRSTAVSPGLPSMSMFLFNKPSRDILPRFSGPPAGCDKKQE